MQGWSYNYLVGRCIYKCQNSFQPRSFLHNIKSWHWRQLHEYMNTSIYKKRMHLWLNKLCTILFHYVPTGLILQLEYVHTYFNKKSFFFRFEISVYNDVKI